MLSSTVIIQDHENQEAMSSLPEHVLQDNLGVYVHWDLGVSPPRPLQHLWTGGLLHFQHVSGDFALCAGGEAQPPCLE